MSGENELVGELRSFVANKMWEKSPDGCRELFETAWKLLPEDYKSFVENYMKQVPAYYRPLTKEDLSSREVIDIILGRKSLDPFLAKWVRMLDLDELFLPREISANDAPSILLEDYHLWCDVIQSSIYLERARTPICRGEDDFGNEFDTAESLKLENGKYFLPFEVIRFPSNIQWLMAFRSHMLQHYAPFFRSTNRASSMFYFLENFPKEGLINLKEVIIPENFVKYVHPLTYREIAELDPVYYADGIESVMQEIYNIQTDFLDLNSFFSHLVNDRMHPEHKRYRANIPTVTFEFETNEDFKPYVLNNPWILGPFNQRNNPWYNTSSNPSGAREFIYLDQERVWTDGNFFEGIGYDTQEHSDVLNRLESFYSDNPDYSRGFPGKRNERQDQRRIDLMHILRDQRFFKVFAYSRVNLRNIKFAFRQSVLDMESSNQQHFARGIELFEQMIKFLWDPDKMSFTDVWNVEFPEVNYDNILQFSVGGYEKIISKEEFLNKIPRQNPAQQP